MPSLSYRQADLVLQKDGGNASLQQVKDFQRDLRQLGYLPAGIDGRFGKETERSVKALQHDLLNNLGRSTKNDGAAPVQVINYNRGRIVHINGIANQSLVECISDMLDDASFAKLPRSDNPREENKKIIAQLSATPSTVVPIPFLLAVFRQESGLKHFNEPRAGDEDTYITVGLDRNADEKFIITSRGYGAGQYTLFHHPPSKEEVDNFMRDPVKNVQKAAAELREKFDGFVNGSTGGTRADDRIVEIGSVPLRLCKFDPQDPRHLKDCKQCLLDAGTVNIQSGITPLHASTAHTYEPTQYYATASYSDVPRREKIGCDWPYAVRRYNGAGVNSYHYQVRILKHLLSL